MRAVGDLALVTSAQDGGIVLCGAHGPIARFGPGGERGDGAEVEDHVALSHPPRLALLSVLDRRVDEPPTWRIELVDVESGAVERTIDGAPVRSFVAFCPAGDALLVNAASGLAFLRDDGRLVPLEANRPDDALDAWFTPDGAAVVARFAFGVARPRVSRFDLRRAVRTWSVDVEARGFAPDAALARAALLVGPRASDGTARLVAATAVDAWDLVDGRRLGEIARAPAGTALRSVWASRDFARVAAMDVDGVVRSYAVAAAGSAFAAREVSARRFPLDALVDVERDRALSAFGAGARLSTLAGEVVAEAERATRVCFAGTGPAVALVDGAVHALSSSGLSLVEGPAELVDIAPHPRGVITLDLDDRAHVLTVDAAEPGPAP